MTPELTDRTGRTIVLLAMAVLVASTGVATFGLGAVAQEETENTFVRVFHGTVDAPAVDVYVGGNQVADNVSFGEMTDEAQVGSGEETVVITEAGDEDAVLYEGSVELEAVSWYTIAVTESDVTEASQSDTPATETEIDTATETTTDAGAETGTPTDTAPATQPETDAATVTDISTASPTGNEGEASESSMMLEPVLLHDNATVTSETALRVANLNANASSVSVVDADSGETIVEDLAYQNSSGYITLPPGDYTFEVRMTEDDSMQDAPTQNGTTEDGAAQDETTPDGTTEDGAAQNETTQDGTVMDSAGEVHTFDASLLAGNAYTMAITKNDTSDSTIATRLLIDPSIAQEPSNETPTVTEESPRGEETMNGTATSTETVTETTP